MKTLLTLLTLVLLSFPAVADDLADAKKAFAALVEYQKTDDERSPELFAKDCSVTFALTDGTWVRLMTVPRAAFIDSMKKSIAEKKGNDETYEDVKYTPEETGIRVTANVRQPKSGRKGPFSALYHRDADGVLRIRELKVTVFVDEPATGKKPDEARLLWPARRAVVLGDA